MKANLFVKVATLTTFALLMSGFVAYKAGAFESYLGVQIDSDSPGKDSIQYDPEMMAPSTKSAAIFEPELPAQKDSPAQQQQQQQNANQAPNQSAAPAGTNNGTKTPVYMNSSKSGGVFPPRTDTTKKPK